jgi:fructokinase
VNPGKRVVIGIGELLWDILPAGRQLGGAPANFACHARSLGADARLVSRIGSDTLGKEILERLRMMGLPEDCVSVDESAPTGTVSVTLAAQGQPSFTIHENAAWDRLTPSVAALALARRADAICFGTLGQRCPRARAAIQLVVAATQPEALRIFDINLRQHYYSTEIIESSLNAANILKLNEQELQVLSDLMDLKGSVGQQIELLAQRHNLQFVALTRGARGSLLYSEGRLSDSPGLFTEVVDAVGAGDAFTAALALALLAKWNLDDANQWANEIACYVCSQSGATPRIPDELKRIGGDT